jgi:hypothetical protein
MVYTEIKNINGKLYKYQRRSVRHKSKIKKVYIKYLGPVKPIYKKDDNKK